MRQTSDAKGLVYNRFNCSRQIHLAGTVALQAIACKLARQ
jgi:hypothetical protein